MPEELHSAAAPERARVLFINLWPQSGMKHYSESLVHALAPCRNLQLFYVRNYESDLPVESLRVHLDPVRFGAWGDLLRLVRAILRLRPRVIHLNSELPVLLPLFPLFAFFNSVITLHDAVPHEGERLAKRLFMRLHLLLIFFFIGKVIVHSAAIRDELPGCLRARTHLLPHVNYQLWAAEKSSARGGGPFTVLFFGRLLRYKGLEYLLDAFRDLDPANFELVIAGEGDLSGYALGGANVRTINRFIPDEEMAALFNAAHVVALPYVSASQSGVAYMAFAFEKPVIATRVGALADIVIDGVNGLLVAPGSAPALADALRQVAEPATWERLVENVRRQNLSADEEIRARLLEIYRA
jgi:glycosyltransferase involved in cell wall biosynthesis